MAKKYIFYDCSKYTPKEIAKFIEDNGYKVDYKFRTSGNYHEYFGQSGRILFIVEDLYIYLEKPEKQENGLYRSVIDTDYTLSKEWKNSMIKYQEGKKLGDMTDYNIAKNQYDIVLEKSDELYRKLKKKFGMPKGQFPKFNKEEQESTENKGFFGKLFGK